MPSIFYKIIFLYKSESPLIVICIFLISKIKNIFIKSKIKYEKRKHKIILSKKIITNDYFSSSAFYFYNLLQKLPKNFKYLEIGSYEGNSALYVSTNFPHSTVTCVDLWEGVEEYKGKDFNIIERNFDTNLKGLSNIKKIKSTSDDFFIKNTIMYDFIYVDGNHKSHYVLRDCDNAWKFLNDGGFIVCDDYIWDYYKDIKLNPCFAVNTFLKKKNKVKILFVSNSQIFLQKIKSQTYNFLKYVDK
jgi:predicted O-methyltransferase YrrM